MYSLSAALNPLNKLLLGGRVSTSHTRNPTFSHGTLLTRRVNAQRGSRRAHGSVKASDKRTKNNKINRARSSQNPFADLAAFPGPFQRLGTRAHLLSTPPTPHRVLGRCGPRFSPFSSAPMLPVAAGPATCIRARPYHARTDTRRHGRVSQLPTPRIIFEDLEWSYSSRRRLFRTRHVARHNNTTTQREVGRHTNLVLLRHEGGSCCCFLRLAKHQAPCAPPAGDVAARAPPCPPSASPCSLC